MDSDFNLKLIVFLIIIIPICLLWVFLFFLFRWIERVERKSTIIHGHIVNIDKWTVHGGTQRARAQLELADGTISDVDVGFWHKKGDSLRLHHYNDKYYFIPTWWRIVKYILYILMAVTLVGISWFLLTM